MKKLFLLNTRTAFIVLLATNAANPLYAFQFTAALSHSTADHSSIQHAVIQNLESRGLDTQAAVDKTSTLFADSAETAAIKLRHLQAHSALALSTESVIETVASRALFGKPLNLDSYASVTGFVQEIKGHALSASERDAIEAVTMLNSSLG
jgi:hypothetical protein